MTQIETTLLIQMHNRVLIWVLAAAVFFSAPLLSCALAEDGIVPARNGMSLNTGYVYDPSEDIRFVQVSAFRLFDYEAVWKHRAPENLRFKVEAAVGSAFLHHDDARSTASAGILALLYLKRLETDAFIPYIEAGIGAIYTDFQVAGQDYRFNFNPQAGVGLEFKRKQSASRFLAIRAHHVSNGGIGSSNRGLNSVLLMAGQFF